MQERLEQTRIQDCWRWKRCWEEDLKIILIGYKFNFKKEEKELKKAFDETESSGPHFFIFGWPDYFEEPKPPNFVF